MERRPGEQDRGFSSLLYPAPVRTATWTGILRGIVVPISSSKVDVISATGERDSPAAGDRRCGSSRKIGCSQMAANREVLCDLKVTAQLRWNQDLSKDRVDKVVEPGDPGLGSWMNMDGR